jgi:hypothetical protein
MYHSLIRCINIKKWPDLHAAPMGHWNACHPTRSLATCCYCVSCCTSLLQHAVCVLHCAVCMTHWGLLDEVRSHCMTIVAKQQVEQATLTDRRVPGIRSVVMTRVKAKGADCCCLQQQPLCEALKHSTTHRTARDAGNPHTGVSSAPHPCAKGLMRGS